MLTSQTLPEQTEAQPLPWQWLARQVDTASYRPAADPQVIAERIEEGDVVYYVLKNPSVGAYLKLEGGDYDLWQLMDSSRTVKDLVVAYFVRRKTFAFGRIAALVNELKEGQFLLDKPVGLYRQAAQQLEEKDWAYRWRELARAFIEYRVPITGLDGYVTTLYQGGGWLFFTPVLQILMWFIALAGLLPFIAQLRHPEQFPIVNALGGGYLEGIALLLIANTIIIFVHELAHALTTKHYGREVPSGGAMIYYGMPAFYVNTMDIWLEPKKNRIAVSWAGPFSGIALGGIFSYLAMLAPGTIWSQFLFKMAFLGYIGCLVNLNPLLELDGYFILVDALGIPLLRERAFRFIRRELPGKLKALISNPEAPADKKTVAREAAFSREELIFTIFGVLAMLYTLYVGWFAFFLLNKRVVDILAGLWLSSGWFGKAAVALLGLTVFIPIGLAIGVTLWRGAAVGFNWLQKRDFFEREQNIALLAFVGLAASIMLPLAFDRGQILVLRIWPLFPAFVAVWSLIVTARQYVGSEMQRQFWSLALSAVLLAAAAAMMAFERPNLALLLTHLAVFPLPAAGLISMIGADLRRVGSVEKWVMLILFLAGFCIAIVLARRADSTVEAFLAGGALFFVAVFLATVMPLLAAYANTRFITPWVLLVAGAMLLAGFNLLALISPSLWLMWLFLAVISLWAVGGFVYATTGWRIRFPLQTWERGFTLSEEQRLRHAFARFFEALFESFRAAFGNRRAQSVDDDLDVIAVTANWNVALDRGRVRDELDLKRMTILEQADRYREALGRAIDLMDNWAGSKFITRAAQAAYDSLPWPERETLGRYVLAGTSWGGAIAHQFAFARGERFQALRSAPLFAGCSNEMLDKILSAARRETAPAGAVLARAGRLYPYFALIMGGEVEVWKVDDSSGHSIMVGELKRGANFGSPVFAPNADSLAPATYRASVPTDILIVDKVNALRLAKEGLSLNKDATRVSLLGQMLAEMPFFAELSPQQIERLLQKMGRQSVAKGQVIVRQGQARQYFYIIEAGEVGVLVAAVDGSEKIVGKLGKGEHFGETSLFTNQPYSATCVALSNTHLLTLDEFTFDRLIATSHRMTHYVEQVSSGRLKDTRRKLGLRQGGGGAGEQRRQVEATRI